jgi:hypothetical protein
MGRTSLMLLKIETPENMQVTCSLLDINNRKETEFGQIVQLR